jgi:transposase
VICIYILSFGRTSKWWMLLQDDQWERIAPLMCGKVGDHGRRGVSNRPFVDAVLWMARTGKYF